MELDTSSVVDAGLASEGVGLLCKCGDDEIDLVPESSRDVVIGISTAIVSFGLIKTSAS